MPTSGQLRHVARDLKRDMNGQAFFTIPRTDITERVREASQEETTRLKAQMASDLSLALLEQGVRCYPPLEETTTGDVVRLFHAGTVLSHILDLLEHPDPADDAELGAILAKVKGTYDWDRQVPPGTGAGDGDETEGSV